MIKVLNEGSHQAQVHAAAAIRNLVQNSQNQDVIVRAVTKVLQEDGGQQAQGEAAVALKRWLLFEVP